MKLYTKKGDSGMTSLMNDVQVSKTDDRIELLGTIDELSSNIGLAKILVPEDVKKELQQLYANLAKFHIDGQRFVVDHIKRPLQQYAECYNLKGVTSRIRKAIEK